MHCPCGHLRYLNHLSPVRHVQRKPPHVHLRSLLLLLLTGVLLCPFHALNQFVNHRSLKHSLCPHFLEGTFIPGRPLLVMEGPEIIRPSKEEGSFRPGILFSSAYQEEEQS
jgi:hypothetical protein